MTEIRLNSGAQGLFQWPAGVMYSPKDEGSNRMHQIRDSACHLQSRFVLEELWSSARVIIGTMVTFFYWFGLLEEL